MFLGPQLASALDLPARPTAGQERLLRTVLAARATGLRAMGPRRREWFVPGDSNSVYPHGYALADLGVAHDREGQ